MDEEIKKMGKQANLRYRASREGLGSKVFWEKCKGQKETIVLVQTDKNSVIGGYCPEQWVDTTAKKSSDGTSGRKDITLGKPFLFYWVNDQIQVINHKDDKTPFMGSDKNWLMVFG